MVVLVKAANLGNDDHVCFAVSSEEVRKAKAKAKAKAKTKTKNKNKKKKTLQ